MSLSETVNQVNLQDEIEDLSEDKETRLRVLFPHSGTLISRAIAAEIPTDSDGDSSSEEEAEEPKKISGRYREVVKPIPCNDTLLERITPDPITGLNPISQLKVKAEVHQESSPALMIEDHRHFPNNLTFIIITE
jgi:hypothetical protein